jgi:hypothetical protein
MSNQSYFSIPSPTKPLALNFPDPILYSSPNYRRIKYPPRIVSIKSPKRFQILKPVSPSMPPADFPPPSTAKPRTSSIRYYVRSKIKTFQPLFHRSGQSEPPTHKLSLPEPRPQAWENDSRSAFSSFDHNNLP